MTEEDNSTTPMILRTRLENQKHERFCKLVSEGLGITDAHEMAGYSRNHSNAANLHRTVVIKQRIATLKHEKSELEEVRNSIKGSEMTIDDIKDKIMELYDACMIAAEYKVARDCVSDLRDVFQVGKDKEKESGEDAQKKLPPAGGKIDISIYADKVKNVEGSVGEDSIDISANRSNTTQKSFGTDKHE